MPINMRKYLEQIKLNPKPAIKIELLNEDETVKKEITNEIYKIDGTLNVSYQDGARRTCTVEIDNSSEQIPINYNAYWIGTKFKVWMGIYINEEAYYFPQGVFGITNPTEVYNPQEKTITLKGTDKWCFLNGTMGGVLSSTFKTYFNQDIRDMVKQLLKMSKYKPIELNTGEDLPLWQRIDPQDPIFNINDRSNTNVIQYTKDKGDILYYIDGDTTSARYILSSDNKYYLATLVGATESEEEHYNTGDLSAATGIVNTNMKIWTKDQSIFLTPYTSTIEAGNTIADILLEYGKMMRASIYYDANGYLRFDALSASLENVADYDKDVEWHFTVTEKELLGLSFEHKWSDIYNDIIILGKISNGYQAKARLQNQDPASPTSIDKIGLKTKKPYSDSKYYSDEQCEELGGWYAQLDMAMNKTGTITSTPLYHLDVNKIVTLSTPKNNMSREQFLIMSYTLPFSGIGSMSLSVVNMRYFNSWTSIKIEN